MSFNKNLIAENFSLGSKTYDDAAQVQLKAAQELVRLISPYLKKDSQILDLGSGTSFISKEILSHEAYSEISITEIDISSEMLNSWKDRPSNITTIQADIEQLPIFEKKFDLIISSFALQWISDFEKNFLNFSSLLKANGILALCLPTQGSLQEFLDFNINEFPTNSAIKEALEKAEFNEKSFSQKIIQQDFATNREALKFLKRIGANSPKKTRLPLKPSSYKNIGNKLSWHISHFISAKND